MDGRGVAGRERACDVFPENTARAEFSLARKMRTERLAGERLSPTLSLSPPFARVPSSRPPTDPSPQCRPRPCALAWPHPPASPPAAAAAFVPRAGRWRSACRGAWRRRRGAPLLLRGEFCFERPGGTARTPASTLRHAHVHSAPWAKPGRGPPRLGPRRARDAGRKQPRARHTAPILFRSRALFSRLTRQPPTPLHSPPRPARAAIIMAASADDEIVNDRPFRIEQVRRRREEERKNNRRCATRTTRTRRPPPPLPHYHPSITSPRAPRASPLPPRSPSAPS